MVEETKSLTECVDHVQIPVKDLTEGSNWYIKYVGLKYMNNSPDPNNQNEEMCFMCLNSGPMVILWKTNDETSITFTKNGEPMPTLMFKTKDIQRMQKVLAEGDQRIVSFAYNPKDFSFLMFYDLYGNRIGAIQDPH